MASPRIVSSGRSAHPRYRWAVILYDRAYRLVHRLDRPRAQVGPALCVEVRRCRRARTLPDGTRIRPGDRLGILHLNNARIAVAHVNGQSPLAVGLEFRRWLLASVRSLAELSAEGGPLADVRAFCAVTIFGSGLARRLGFESEPDGLVWPGLVTAYQRALLASLHPEGPLGFARTRHGRARRFWITREALGSRYRYTDCFGQRIVAS